jgi:hypothetical protein
VTGDHHDRQFGMGESNEIGPLAPVPLCVGRRPGQWARYGGRPDDTMAGDSVTERLNRAECSRFSCGNRKAPTTRSKI